MGQHATDISIAKDVVRTVFEIVGNDKVIKSILEPSCGTGSFVSAIRQLIGDKLNIVGIEKDKLIYEYAKELWKEENTKIINEDFLLFEQKENYDMVIANPPYTRHQHLDKEYKELLKDKIKQELDYNISGYASLYLHFILSAHKYLKENSYSAWLIPAEFMNVNYTSVLRHYMTNKVTVLKVHKYDTSNGIFKDALVSSAIIIFKNKIPTGDEEVEFSYGDSISTPQNSYIKSISELRNIDKWDNIYIDREYRERSNFILEDLFDIKRGIATGNNEFFILDEDTIKKNNFPMQVFKPILPSIRYIKEDIIETDDEGNVNLEKKLFVIDTDLDITTIKDSHSEFYDYLNKGLIDGVKNGYLVSKRKIWYKQEYRKPPLFLCTYMARSKNNNSGFRFLLNKSNAIATNTYLLIYPKPKLQKIINEHNIEEEIFTQLQSITHEEFTANGREYGGGLKKVEPKELGKISVNNIIDNIQVIKDMYLNNK